VEKKMSKGHCKVGVCGCCGRTKSLIAGGNCGWCYSKKKSGLTEEQVQELFVNHEPRPGGKRKATLQDAARLSERLDPAAAPISIVVEKLKDFIENSEAIPKDHYPVRKMIPCWECSDGAEYGNETDALRHEVDRLQRELFKRRKA
jgi:hypothetical protein